MRQYGHSKESRPNPIVQMGLFTDKDGIPLAVCISPGNTAETTTLKPLEDKLSEKFGISKVVVCTDGRLAGIQTFSLNQEMIDQEARFDGFRTDTQIVSKQRMKAVIADSKKYVNKD